MKITKSQIVKFLVAAAIFLAFGHLAPAANNFSVTDAHPVVSKLTPEPDNPLVVDKLSISERWQSLSQQEYFGSGFTRMLSDSRNFGLAHVSLPNYASYKSKDKRELIFQYLFPFHFHW